MKVLFIFLAIIAQVFGFFQPPQPDVYWFTQKFDHFNDSDVRTFQQRYLVYDKYWLKGDSKGPIFFTPGGESDVFGGYNHNGFMFEFGGPLGTFMLFPEHRFYGQSLPFGPVDSYSPENIKKLTVQQAIEDYMVIIRYVRQKWGIPEEVKLVSFGGSYPGELAAFMRVAYPAEVAGALASSAPVRYHSGLTFSGGFYEVVTGVFSEEDDRCAEYVRGALAALLLLDSSPSGRQQLVQLLKLCRYPSPSSFWSPARQLVLWVENAFATLAMENYPYAVGTTPAWPLGGSCSLLSAAVHGRSDPSSLLAGLSLVLSRFYNDSQQSCFDLSKDFYPCADITGCGTGTDGLSWDYQSCSQIVANVDTNNQTDMFPPSPYNFSEIVRYCQKTWNTAPDPLFIPKLYNYSQSSNIIFSNGFYDPWLPGGQLQDLGNSIRAFLIPKAAHHLDLRGSDPADPNSVVGVRELEREVILQWLDLKKSFE